jgi:hypothetical protein
MKIPLTNMTPKATRSVLVLRLEKSTFQIPREYKLRPITVISAAKLKKRAGRYEPPIGLSLPLKGRLVTMDPKR